MDERKKNLLVRILSALVLLPLVLLVLWFGGIPLAILVSLASAMVAFELQGMAGVPTKHPAAIFGMLAAAAFPWLALDLSSTWPAALGIIALTPIAVFSLATIFPVGGDLSRTAPLASWIATSVPYAGLLSCVVALRALPSGEGLTWTVLALAVTWGNDTGAYFAGVGFGKRKLYPKVSPNKTWEGFAGGVFASILACWLVRLFDPSLTWTDVFVVGVVSAILGPLGDLSESMIKRAHGVKDSGKLIPGHGGIFDRIDALLFIAPWVLAYVRYLRG